MLNRFPLISRIFLFILLPLAVTLSGAFYLVSQSVPDGNKEITVKGISAQVNIDRDSYGVPSIHSKTDADAFFALGFVHAQDRLWQLEYQRRLAKGRLSEILGRSKLREDMWFRTLDLYGAAESAWSAISKDAQMSLTSYSAGINAGIESVSVLPPEFLMLSIEPEPWTELDSLALIKLFALNLSQRYRTEMQVSMAIEILGNTYFRTFFPQFPLEELFNPSPVSAIWKQQREQFIELVNYHEELENSYVLDGRYIGSNAWVVSGKHLKDGKSILANDPHLPLQIPSPWYMAEIKSDRLKVTGMSLVGLPVIVFGHNEDIAWGITNMNADTQDIYIERTDVNYPSKYYINGGWNNFIEQTEEINIRSEVPAFLHKQYKPVSLRVRKSVHGPIISDQVPGMAGTMALRWPGLDGQDTTYEAFFNLNYAHDWDSFRQSLKKLVTPTLNILYSDSDGNIGYQGAGKIPVRKLGKGILPSVGWNDTYSWDDYIPFEDMPHVYNPDEGYFINANDDVTDPDYPYFITYDWADPARSSRIQELLDKKIIAGEAIRIEDIQDMQIDTLSIHARKLIPLLTGFKPKKDKSSYRKALNYIRNWDGDMSTGSQAATIFNMWMRYTKRALFLDELQQPLSNVNLNIDSFLTTIVDNVSLDVVYDTLETNNSDWCDNVNSPIHDSCSDILEDALEDALLELTRLMGNDIDDWQWGNMLKAKYSHLGMEAGHLFDIIFNRTTPGSGYSDTINVANCAYTESIGCIQNHGANFRMVIQFNVSGDDAEVFYMNSTGQSGNIMSEHYDGMISLFHNNRYINLAESLQGPSLTTYKLIP